MNKALVFGGTGLVGGLLLADMARSGQPAQVVAVTRRPLSLPVPSANVRNLVLDPARLAQAPLEEGADTAFCCLGTTIATAGSRDAFRAVDFDLVLRCAEWSLRCGVQHFLVVSAVGADRRSPVYYNRVKGDMETALRAMGFARLSIFQPSLLLGERAEHRLGEAIAMRVSPLVSPLMVGPLRKLRPIAAATVARGLLGQAQAPAGERSCWLQWAEIRAAAGRAAP